MFRQILLTCGLLVIGPTFLCSAQDTSDWRRFRGANGTGISSSSKSPPTRWSETENLQWKFELPGSGFSSPIVVGQRVFVTCWTGKPGSDSESETESDIESASAQPLRRHLICVDRQTGTQQWIRSNNALLPEDPIKGMMVKNGFASHTPVSDGNSVYTFFGKSGLFAFSLDGDPLWNRSVGSATNPQKWGSSASPIVFEELVIVNASAESRSIVALNKVNGDEVWRFDSDLLFGADATPTIARVSDSRSDLILSVPGQLLALNPRTGEQVWNCRTWGANVTCESPLVSGDTVYLIGGRTSRAVAIKGGGESDVSKSNIRWNGYAMNRISTPVIHNEKIYWVNQGAVYVIDASTGKLGSRTSISTPKADTDELRRLLRQESFSSPVVAGDKMYYFRNSGHGYVFQLGSEKVTEIGRNHFGSDRSSFNATPAISDGELFIRSQKYLYCISAD